VLVFLAGAGVAGFLAAAFVAAFFAALAGAFLGVVAEAFLAVALFVGAAFVADAFADAVLDAGFDAAFDAAFDGAFPAAAAFFADPPDTTLRAAAPARLTRDFLLADAMVWGPLSGDGKEARRTCWREDMWRAEPLQPAVPEHSPTVLAHWTHREAWRGPVPDCTATSELGTV